MKYRYNASPRPTIGVEEEYQICDPSTGDLVPRVNELMAHADEDTARFLAHDLIQGLIEAVTDIAETVDEATADLAAKRQRMLSYAEAEGCTLGITGAHPYADPRKTEFVATEAYRWVRNQLRYVAGRNLSFGLHVHVGVDDAERAIYVANRLRRWIGPLIAIAANSPFLDGVDTGWDSARSVAFGSFPRSGVPPRLRNWAHYEQVMRGLEAADSIQNPRHVWWNVRAHPTFGTVEIRACDVQMSLRRTAAIAALCQALVVEYGERHRAGEAEPAQDQEFLDDGRFKGMRFGLDATVIDAETHEIMSMQEMARLMVADAGEASASLGTESHLRMLSEIIESQNGATYQRALAEELGGDLVAVQLRLLDEARSLVLEPDVTL